MKFKKLVLALLAGVFLNLSAQAEVKNNINLETTLTKDYSKTLLKFGRPAQFNPKNYLGFYLVTENKKLSKDSYIVSNLELKIINTKFTVFSDFKDLNLLDEVRFQTTLPGFSLFDKISFGGGLGKKESKNLRNLNLTFNFKNLGLVSDLEVALGYTKISNRTNPSSYIFTRINEIQNFGDLFVGFGYNNHNYFAVIGNTTFKNAHCSIGGKSLRFIPIYNSVEKSFKLYSLFAFDAFFGFNTPMINLTNIDADKFPLVNWETSFFHDINTGQRNPYRHEQHGRGFVVHSTFENSPSVLRFDIEPKYNFSKQHPYHEEPYDLADGAWVGFLYGVIKDKQLREISHKFELKAGLTLQGYSVNFVLPLHDIKTFKIFAAKNLRF